MENLVKKITSRKYAVMKEISVLSDGVQYFSYRYIMDRVSPEQNKEMSTSMPAQLPFARSGSRHRKTNGRSI